MIILYRHVTDSSRSRVHSKIIPEMRVVDEGSGEAEVNMKKKSADF